MNIGHCWSSNSNSNIVAVQVIVVSHLHNWLHIQQINKTINTLVAQVGHIIADTVKDTHEYLQQPP